MAKKKQSKSSALPIEAIDERVSYAKSLHSSRVQEQDEWQSIANLEKPPVAAEDGVVTVQLPTPWRDTRNFVSALSTNDPLWKVFPEDSTTQAKLDAELSENTLLSLIETYEDEQGCSIVYDLAYYGGQTGWYALRVLHDGNAPDGYSAYRFDCLDPKTVFPVPGAYGWEFVVEITKQRGSNLVSLFPDLSLDYKTDYEVQQYWDRDVRSIKVGAEWALPPTAHGYGFIPYSIGFVDGVPRNQTRLTGTNATERWGVGQVFAAKDLYELQNDLWGQMHTFVINNVSPVMALYLAGGNSNPDRDSYQNMRPGTQFVFDSQKGEKAEPLRNGEWPRNAEYLAQSYGMEIQKTTYPDALSGVDMGDRSGVLMKTLQNAPRTKVAVARQSLERVLARGGEMALMLYAKFGSKNELVGRTRRNGQAFRMKVDKKQVLRSPKVRCSIKPHFVEDEAVNASIAGMWTRVPGVPSSRIIEQWFPNAQDVEAMKSEWLSEQLSAMPEMQKLAALEELKKLNPQLANLFAQAMGLGPNGQPQPAPTQTGPPQPNAESPFATGMPSMAASPEMNGMPEGTPQQLMISSPEQLGGI